MTAPTQTDWPAKCAVVIPCLNEAASVGPLIAQIRPTLPAIIVVDDGSADQTAQLAEQAGAVVLRCGQNHGKGAALNRGLLRARELGFSWAMMLDGDGQHSPGDIPAFLAAAERTRARLIVGNRMAQPQGMPWLRRFVNRWMSRRLSKRAGHRLPDTQCGFRLLDLTAWSELQLRTSRFEVESEMLLAFLAAGHAVEFVPIQTIYKSERSKIHPVTDTCRWFRWWWGRNS